jgi:hypothetical protein
VPLGGDRSSGGGWAQHHWSGALVSSAHIRKRSSLLTACCRVAHNYAYTHAVTTKHSPHHHPFSPGGALNVQPLLLEYIALHVSCGEKTVISHLRATLSYKTIVQVLACGRTAHPSSWHTSAWATHDKVECRKICNRSQVTYRLWHCVELQEVNGWSTDPCTSTNTLWVDSVLT